MKTICIKVKENRYLKEKGIPRYERSMKSNLRELLNILIKANNQYKKSLSIINES